MADNDATQRRAYTGVSVGKGESSDVKSLVSTLELAGSASGQTINFGQIPSNARIVGGVSNLYWDDLATSGAPTIDLGLENIDSNITDDPDALNDGLDVTSAGSASVVKDKADYGLPAWDYVNGQSEDPGGSFTVLGTVKDAATNATGTVTLELLYYLD